MSQTITLPVKPALFYPPIIGWKQGDAVYQGLYPHSKKNQLRERPQIDITVSAALPTDFNSGSFCHEFTNVRVMLESVGTDATAILNAALLARAPAYGGTSAEYLLRRLIQDLPIKRDWLDPDIERSAKTLLGIT